MKNYLDWLFRDSKFVEVRQQGVHNWTTGWFDNPDDLIQQITPYANIGNLFTSLNQPHLRNVTNRMSEGEAITNDSIKIITRMFYDFDPERPKNTSATDVEICQAIDVRDNLVMKLAKIGWPFPLLAMSGNGAHAQFRVALPNNAETSEMITAIYRGFKSEYSTDEVSFDTSVKNPGRICALYGTVKRKGIETPERPHRQSVYTIPNDWQQVTKRQVEEVANAYSRKPERETTSIFTPRQINGQGDYSTLDVVGWFTAHGLYKRPSDEPGKHFVTCPWCQEHSSEDHYLKTDSIIYENDTNSWPEFHCSHDHCEGRRIIDVMKLWRDMDSFCSRNYGGHRNDA